MYSAGNDIIALGAINIQRSNDYRFYSKILSAPEQLLYQGLQSPGMPFEQFLWLLWSVKESAYKYLKRGLSGLVFSPTKIIIRHINFPQDQQPEGLEDNQWQGGDDGKRCYTGSFTYGAVSFYFRSHIYAELIATVVSEDEKFEHTWWGIRKIEHGDTDHQSKEVRSFLLNKLNILLPGNDLRIEKTAIGYPVILQGTKELGLPVSFAHHGNFVAYSFLLN